MTELMEKRADAVFEGGGVKGIGFAGALDIAEKKGVLWQNVAGTSAGAIVAALVASGYTASEIKDILDTLDYTKFKDPTGTSSIPGIGPVASILINKGIYRGEYFQEWIAGLLKAKNVTTFRDLIVPGEADERYRFKLRVIASDITDGKIVILPQDITGYGLIPEDLNVALAVRMSMSIPYFYRPVSLTNVKTGRKNYLVDGGILSNFPVWLFDTHGSEPEWPTFGFKLIEPDSGSPHEIEGPVSMLTALFSTMMEAHDSRHVQESDFVRTIAIPTLGVKTTEFDISREKSKSLYVSGRQAALSFFSNWNFREYIRKYRR